MAKYFVIGDVHGCYDELSELLEDYFTNKNYQDRTIVFLGDLIDKGPQSSAVVQMVKYLQSPVILIQGNHEAKHIAQAKKGVPTEVELTTEQQDFLRRAAHPFYTDGQVTFVHGGLNPAFKGHYGALPDMSQPQPKKVLDRISRFRFVRYCNPDGNPVSLGSETPEDKYWADTYDGWAGHVFFGHQPHNAVTHYPYATAVDTGCVHGDYLTGLYVDDGKVTGQIQVKAKQKYAEKIVED